MLVRAIRMAENLAILSLLTGSALALHVAAARVHRQRLLHQTGEGNWRPGRANR
jgi:hypothetical protein